VDFSVNEQCAVKYVLDYSVTGHAAVIYEEDFSVNWHGALIFLAIRVYLASFGNICCGI